MSVSQQRSDERVVIVTGGASGIGEVVNNAVAVEVGPLLDHTDAGWFAQRRAGGINFGMPAGTD